jgi:hypothetical protein
MIHKFCILFTNDLWNSSKETCGTLPTIMECYNLQEVTTLVDLYSKITIKFQEHSKVSNVKVK